MSQGDGSGTGMKKQKQKQNQKPSLEKENDQGKRNLKYSLENEILRLKMSTWY